MMKIGVSFPGFNISAKGLSVQRKKMDLIAENIANADSIRTQDGQPYKRKFLSITKTQSSFTNALSSEGNTLKMNTTNKFHIAAPAENESPAGGSQSSLQFSIEEDAKPGEVIYMPDHPDANPDGYVQMSNVNIITEMVDMIAATRSYEANLTALNASKQMAKDSLEI